MIIKFTVAMTNENAPVFMVGEEPGVFVTQIMEIEDDATGAMFAKWLIEQEEKLIKECVKVRIYRKDDDEDLPAA